MFLFMIFLLFFLYWHDKYKCLKNVYSCCHLERIIKIFSFVFVYFILLFLLPFVNFRCKYFCRGTECVCHRDDERSFQVCFSG